MGYCHPPAGTKEEGNRASSKGREDESSGPQGGGSSSTSSPAIPSGAQRGQEELQDIAVSHAATHSLRSFEDIFGPSKATETSGTDAKTEDDAIDIEILAPAAQVPEPI